MPSKSDSNSLLLFIFIYTFIFFWSPHFIRDPVNYSAGRKPNENSNFFKFMKISKFSECFFPGPHQYTWSRIIRSYAYVLYPWFPQILLLLPS
jgi:hypothetical protein